MSPIQQISIPQAQSLHQQGSAIFLDIRDPHSYESGHIPGALLLNESSLEPFIAQADKAKTLIVCCYHGISSQGAAAYLQERGFTDVHSLIGGYEAWVMEVERKVLP